MKLTAVLFSLLTSGVTSVQAAQDHVLFYKGTVHWTDLSGTSFVPSDQPILLKKEITPSKREFTETATMLNYQNKMCDAATTIKVNGNTASAQTDDRMIIGTGTIQDVGPNGDFTYLFLNLVVVPTGTTIKDVNYINSTKLIARKEISNSAGKPITLWESDLSLIAEDEYQSLYQTSGSIGSCL